MIQTVTEECGCAMIQEVTEECGCAMIQAVTEECDCAMIHAVTEECGCAMIQAASRRPFTEKAHVRLRASQCEIRARKNGIGTGVSSIALVSTCPYDPINPR
jgi:hypothetical protein